MKKQAKLWGTGVLSAIVAACSGIWPAAASTVCAGSFCGTCSGGCFAGFNLLWLGVLSIRRLAGTFKQKISDCLSALLQGDKKE